MFPFVFIVVLRCLLPLTPRRCDPRRGMARRMQVGGEDQEFLRDALKEFRKMFDDMIAGMRSNSMRIKELRDEVDDLKQVQSDGKVALERAQMDTNEKTDSIGMKMDSLNTGL